MDKSSHSESDGLTLTEFFRVLKHRKFLILVIIFVVVITTLLFTLSQPKWYKAVTGIRVEKAEGKVAIFSTRSNVSYDPYFIKEQTEIIKSKQTIIPVLDDKELRVHEFLSEQLGGLLTTEIAYQYFINKMLDVNESPGTALIDIGVLVQEDPDLAADIANKIAETYARNRIEFAVADQTESISKIRESLKDKEQAVTTARDEVERLRGELEISGMEVEIQSTQVEVETVRLLEKNYLAAQVEAIARQTRWEGFSRIPSEDRLNLVNSELIQDQNIQNLMEAYLLAEQSYVQMKGRFGENHPDYIATEGARDKMHTQLLGLLDGFERALEMAFEESNARMRALKSQLDEARKEQISAAQSKMRPFEEAVKKLRLAETTYQTIEMQMQQREIDLEVPKRTIEILNPAAPPMRAHKPNLWLNLGIAGFVGMVFGVGSAFLSEFFDTSFRTVDDMERMMELPILGVVSRKLFVVSEATASSSEAEPFRVIQTNLEFAREEEDAQVLTVQSAGPGEGKSTTLYNIAVTTAMSRQSVLVIDSDLRRPSQHRLFKCERKPGLIDYLTGAASIDDIIQESEVPGLFFIPSGHHVSHFTLSILHRQQLHELIERLRERFDRVFLDSPPVIGISDSSMLAKEADGVVMVIQHKRNPSSMTLRAKQIIENVDGKILGIVLNQVPLGGSEDYNYYTSNYDYYGSTSGKHAEDSDRGKKNGREEPVDGKEVLRLGESDRESFELRDPADKS